MLLLVFACLAACAGRTPPGRTVRSIHFEGNGGALGSGTADYNLRQAMEQQDSPAFAWLAPSHRVALDRDTLDLDAWRMETWYAHRGFFDARFLAWDVVEIRPESRLRGPIVRVRGQVAPGAPSLVTRIEMIGVDEVGAPILNLVRAQSELKEGERFDLDALQAMAALLESRLREQSYAYARVRPEVLALPEEQRVEVRLVADLGPSCTFGEVLIEGDTRIKDEVIAAEIQIEQGSPFRLGQIAQTKQKLFSLGTFSVVNIEPQLRWDEAGLPVTVIPVRIDLAETSFRQVKVGGGFSVEPARQEVQVSGELSHVNVFNRLWRADLGASLGYASAAAWTDIGLLGVDGLLDEGGPTSVSFARLSIPRFPIRRMRLENELRFELGVEDEYRFATPEASTAIVWQATRRWSSQLGYRIRYFDYFDSTLPESTSLLDLRGKELGLDFSDPYLLSMIFQQIKYDSRDDLLFPRRGSYGVLDLSEAGGPLAGDFGFVKALVDARIYRPVPAILGWRPHATITARLAGGAAVPVGSGDDARVPFAERIFVGGATTVRGWSNGHLGPYLYPYTDPNTLEQSVRSSEVAAYPESTDITWIGGRAALYGGLELRTWWLDTWGLAMFSDFGRAWDGAGVASWEDLEARLLQIGVTAGAGLRYKSQIGPIRLDVAVRLDDFPMYWLEKRWLLHFALGEAW